MDLLPYIIVLICLTFFLTVARRNVITKNNSGKIILRKYSTISTINIIISYLIFIIFSIFRVIDAGLGGIDANRYKRIFNSSGGNIIESINSQPYEPGYSLIIWFSRTISEDYRIALFFIYSIMFLFLVNFIKYINWSRYTPVSIFLLLTMWISSFNTTRVILAIFIGTFVYTLLFKRKYKSAIIVAIIACTIHLAATVLFPIIAIVIIVENKSRFNPVKLIFLVLSLSIFFLISISLIEMFIIGTRYSGYVEYRQGDLALGTYAIIAISFIVSLIKFNDLVKFNTYNKILIIVLPVGLSLFVLQTNFFIVYRMVLFFLPILYVLIPDLIRAVSIKKNRDVVKIPIKLLLFSYLVYKIYGYFTISIDSAGVPYINILFK